MKNCCIQIPLNSMKIIQTILPRWFKQRHDAKQAASHNVNQWWPVLLMHICATRSIALSWMTVLTWPMGRVQDYLQSMKNGICLISRKFVDLYADTISRIINTSALWYFYVGTFRSVQIHSPRCFVIYCDHKQITFISSLIQRYFQDIDLIVIFLLS